MKVLSYKKYDIYIYNEIGCAHHLPHCHIRCADANIVVALPTLMIIVGEKLPRDVRKILEDNLEYLCEPWNEINPN